MIQKILNPSTVQKVTDGRQFPVYQTPEKKVSVNQLKAILRNHYQGEKFDPYVKAPVDPMRPISVFRTYESHVMQIRPDLPRAIGEVNYVAFGMAALGVYVPFYQGISKVPAHYGMGEMKSDSVSAYWKYRKLQTLAMSDYVKLAPIVQKGYKTFEADLFAKQEVMEKKYLKLYKSQPKAAQKLLDSFTFDALAAAESVTDDLFNQCMTIRTADIEESLKHNNRGKKD